MEAMESARTAEIIAPNAWLPCLGRRFCIRARRPRSHEREATETLESLIG